MILLLGLAKPDFWALGAEPLFVVASLLFANIFPRGSKDTFFPTVTFIRKSDSM